MVERLQLDILIFADTMSEPMTHFLAHSRLALIQVHNDMFIVVVSCNMLMMLFIFASILDRVLGQSHHLGFEQNRLFHIGR